MSNWASYLLLWFCIGCVSTSFLLVTANPTDKTTIQLMTGSQVLAFCVVTVILWPIAIFCWACGEFWVPPRR